MSLPKLLDIPKNPKDMHLHGPARSQEALSARREEAFRLRVEEGKTHAQIAKILDVSAQTVSQDLQVIAKMKYEGMIEKDQIILVETNAHLDDLISKWKPIAMSPNLVVGETRERPNGNIYDITLPVWESTGAATDKLLKVLELKAKINGLTAQSRDRKADETGRNIANAVYQAFSELARRPVKAEVVENVIENE